MPLTITLICAAALAFINIWLAIRAMTVRMKTKIVIGDGGDSLMTARMRAHSNFSEYVPLALILMALIELQGGAGLGLWAIGVALIIGRLIHPFGMERPIPNVLRPAALFLTIAPTFALAVWAVVIVFQAEPKGKPEPVYFGAVASERQEG